MLEEMAEFFAARIDGYEEHMMQNIAHAQAFYPETAALLPLHPGFRLLDLGCGTGLELDEIFRICPDISVTGIDLCGPMLEALHKKPYASHLHLIQGSYFDLPFGEGCFDGAVSVESLHHFTAERKLPLYRKIHQALKAGGVYVETDYAAVDEQEEAFYFAEYAKFSQNARPGDYHYDTPLTANHTMALLKQAGFTQVILQNKYENTALIVAKK